MSVVRTPRWALVALLAVLAFRPASARENPAQNMRAIETALDKYLAAPDPSYQWKVAEKKAMDGLTVFAVDMTSQTWRAKPEVDRPEWKHRVFVVVPDGCKYDTAFMFIAGGSNEGDGPKMPELLSLPIAKGTKSVVVELRMIPNQPLVFNEDGQRRKEDDLIAYTWNKVIETGDPTWSARLPMVKSAVRAMDTTQALLASDEGGKLAIDKFVVAGGSKRGWTTWLTAAVDKRVTAIIPAVIDVLNVRKSMTHHFEAYGFWAPAVGDYVRHKIMEKQNHPGYDKLLEFEDPYSYRDRFTMPKFVINASGDQFFVPTSSQFYFEELPGEKYLRYVPNAEHSLGGTDAPLSIQAFYQSIIDDTPRPKFSWTLEDDGAIRVAAEDKPAKVLLWQATNPDARDFRVDTIGRTYKSTKLEPQGDGVYVANVSRPEKGFTAYFVELEFPSGGRAPFKFTTNVRVSPDVLPFKGKLEETFTTGGQ